LFDIPSGMVFINVLLPAMESHRMRANHGSLPRLAVGGGTPVLQHARCELRLCRYYYGSIGGMGLLAVAVLLSLNVVVKGPHTALDQSVCGGLWDCLSPTRTRLVAAYLAPPHHRTTAPPHHRTTAPPQRGTPFPKAHG
jgi:hypothetical protein